MRKIFRIYDDDDNGLITARNLMHCAKTVEEYLTEEECLMMIKLADV